MADHNSESSQDISRLNKKINTLENKLNALTEKQKERYPLEQEGGPKEIMGLIFNHLRVFHWGFGIIITVVIIFSGIQFLFSYGLQGRFNSYIAAVTNASQLMSEASEKETKMKLMDWAKKETEKDFFLYAFRAKIEYGRIQLKFSENQGEIDQAVWHNLLGPLKYAREKKLLKDLLPEYWTVLPLLKIELDQKHYKGSYRGILWICSMLLEYSYEYDTQCTREKHSLHRAVDKMLPKNEELENLVFSLNNINGLTDHMRGEIKEAVKYIIDYRKLGKVHQFEDSE